MVIKPTREVVKALSSNFEFHANLDVDVYPDADFAGMYGHEKPTDPACAKSRSGFIILFAGVPILWQSRLQTETALSIMEAEVIALAACMTELIPIINMVKELTQSVGLQAGDVNMNVSVHEDNLGALVLGRLSIPINPPSLQDLPPCTDTHYP
jgi:hypothetical protein